MLPLTHQIFHGLSHNLTCPATTQEQSSFSVFNNLRRTLFDCPPSTLCFRTPVEHQEQNKVFLRLK